MRVALIVLLILSLVALPACQMNERLSGTVMGGVGGAVVGAAVGGFGGGVIGLLAGGLAGYLVGDYVADRRERGRAQVFGPESQPQAAFAPTGGQQPASYGPSGMVAGIKARAPATGTQRVDHSGARAAYQRGKSSLTAPEARVHFEESVRLDPSRPEPYNALALNALYRGDTAEAERYFRKSLEVDPNYQPARFNFERFQRQHLR